MKNKAFLSASVDHTKFGMEEKIHSIIKFIEYMNMTDKKRNSDYSKVLMKLYDNMTTK